MSDNTEIDDTPDDREVTETPPEDDDTSDQSSGAEGRGLDNLGSEVEVEGDASVDEEEAGLLGGLDIESTSDIEVPDRLVDQVIGQDHARDVIKKAAKQRRHVMMIG